ncbi:hypothetical protein [Conservatibacter flavescens]|uniref:hypothetical protein n=1 Tax=Conservatibacter flavescens TaxID=28161 RepID=UPI001A9C789D|nr:hypothetical protein [Conservatibacter flavescens]
MIFKKSSAAQLERVELLFAGLGLGEYKNHETTLKQCKEWHACIDIHGKEFRLNPNLDEGFLQKVGQNQPLFYEKLNKCRLKIFRRLFYTP